MTRVPSPPAAFVGRDAELARLQALLAQVGATVLYGVGGVGKSALACAVAAGWPGPVVYHKLTERESIASLADQVRRQLAGGPVPETADDPDRVRDLALRLNAAAALWVLDDLHQLAPGDREALLRTLVPALRAGRLVITSRELWPRAPDAPDRAEIRLAGLDPEGAEALWSSLNALYGPSSGFERANAFSRGNPFLLRRTHAGGLEGDDPIAAAVRAFDPDERLVAGALALADPALPVETVAALLPDGRAHAALRRLVSRLVVDVDGRGTSAVHDLFRDGIRAGLAADERRAIGTALARLLPTAELEPVVRAREVTRHLCALGRYDDAARWLGEVSRALIRQGAAGDLVRCIESIPREHRPPELTIMRARAFGRLLDPRRGYDALERLVVSRAEPRVLLGLAFAQNAALTGRIEVAARVLSELLAEAGSAPPVLVRTAWALVRTYQGHGEEAREAIAAAGREADDPLVRGSFCFCRAFSLWLDERDTEALEAMRAALSCFDEEQSTALRGVIFGPGIYAQLLARSGRFAEAEAWARRAETVRAGRTDLLSQLYLKGLRASLQLERGERRAALEAYVEVRDAFERAGHALGALWATVAIARLLLLLGRRHEGTALLDRLTEEAAGQGLASFVRAAERCRLEDVLVRVRAPATPAALAETTRGFGLQQRMLEALRAAAAGQAERTRSLVASCAEAIGSPDTPVERAVGHLALAVLARVEGRAADAGGAMREAVAAAERDGVDADLIPSLEGALGRLRVLIGTAGHLLPEAPADPGPDTVVIDTRTHELRASGRVVAFGTRPVLRELLYALAGRPGRVVTKDELAQALWSRDYNPITHDNALKSNVTHLRRLLRDTGLVIAFEGAGYRLSVPERFVFIEGEPG